MSQKNVDFIKKVKYQYKKQMATPPESVVVKSSQRLLNAQINTGDVIVDSEMPIDFLGSTVDWDEGVVNDLIVKIDANDDSVYVIQDLSEEPNVPNENIDGYVDSLGNDFVASSLPDGASREGSLIAVGSSHYDHVKNTVQVSTNGITWDQVGTLTNGNWKSIAYARNKGLYVVVGSNGTIQTMYSTDGLNWTGDDISVTTNGSTNICYSESLEIFVASGVYTTDPNIYSTDGITWALIPSMDLGRWTGCCFSEKLGMFVAVGYNFGNDIRYSTDGLNWTTTYVTPSTGQFYDVCYSEVQEKFVGVGRGFYNNVFHSTDGINWTATNMSPTASAYCESICYSEKLDLYVAARETDDEIDKIYYSSDGVTWTPTSAGLMKNITDVIYDEAQELFVAVSRLDTNNIGYSADGISWTISTVPDGSLTSVIFKEDTVFDNYVSENYQD